METHNTHTHYGLLAVPRNPVKDELPQIHHLHMIPPCSWSVKSVVNWTSLEKVFLSGSHMSLHHLYCTIRLYTNTIAINRCGDGCHQWNLARLLEIGAIRSEDLENGGNDQVPQIDLYEVILPSSSNHCLTSQLRESPDRLFELEKNFGLYTLEANFPTGPTGDGSKLFANPHQCVVHDQYPERSLLSQRVKEGNEKILELSDECYVIQTDEYLKSPSIYGRAVFTFWYERVLYDEKEDEYEYCGKYQMFIHPKRVFLAGSGVYFYGNEARTLSFNTNKYERLEIMRSGEIAHYNLKEDENLVTVLNEPGVYYTFVNEKKWI